MAAVKVTDMQHTPHAAANDVVLANAEGESFPPAVSHPPVVPPAAPNVGMMVVVMKHEEISALCSSIEEVEWVALKEHISDIRNQNLSPSSGLGTVALLPPPQLAAGCKRVNRTFRRVVSEEPMQQDPSKRAGMELGDALLGC